MLFSERLFRYVNIIKCKGHFFFVPGVTPLLCVVVLLYVVPSVPAPVAFSYCSFCCFHCYPYLVWGFLAFIFSFLGEGCLFACFFNSLH